MDYRQPLKDWSKKINRTQPSKPNDFSKLNQVTSK
jgi:hypothetical protein